jgi:putative ABC transport system permease protein
MKFAVLFHRYILRDLAGNRVRTLLTLGGVALGIAVVVAVQLANERAIGSFNDSLSLLSGGADLRISANGLSLDEDLLGELAWVWDVGAMTAVVEGRADIVAPVRTRPLRVFGIDLLSDAPFRSYQVANDQNADVALDITRAAFIDLLVDPRTIVIPAALAAELNVAPGDELELLVANRRRNFEVASVLEDAGVAQAFEGRIVIMDIAAAQWTLGRLGAIDRIEILLDESVDDQVVAERLRLQLPDSVIVDRPSDGMADTERMTRAFRYNLTALSYIALVVGMILIYNTLNIAVTRRRTEIGALRTLGTDSQTIRRMFLIEATAFGVVGAVIGVWLGALLANSAGALVSGTISMIYTGTPVAGGASRVDWTVYAQMIVLGGLLAAVSGTGPTWRATRIPPVEALRAGSGGGFGEPSASPRWTVLGIAALVAGILLSFAPPVAGFPFLGYAAGVAFMIGFGLLSPRLARWMLPPLRRAIVQLLPAEGRLAAQTIEGSLGRIAVAVMSLAIAVAMLMSVAIMVESFRDTVLVWVDQTLEGDLYLRPAASGGDGGRNVMDPGVVDVLEGMSDVTAIDRFRATAIDYNGFTATLASGEFETIATHSRLLFLGERTIREVADQLIGQDRVVVSEPFAVRHSVAAGDTIMLPSPNGTVAFGVEAVFYDYSSEGGLVVMDRGTWARRFGDSAVNNVAVYLAPGADAQAVRREIAENASGAGVRIATNGELREQVLRVFDQTFEVTYALEAIALAVAMLGITNTMAALILERRRELAMLRFVGAARRQIRRIVVIEAGLIGALGSAIGMALGLVLSLLLVYVINFQSFGWTIQFALPGEFILQSLAIVLAATLAAGFYPASLALRLDPIRAIRAE